MFVFPASIISSPRPLSTAAPCKVRKPPTCSNSIFGDNESSWRFTSTLTIVRVPALASGALGLESRPLEAGLVLPSYDSISQADIEKRGWYHLEKQSERTREGPNRQARKMETLISRRY